MSDQVDFVWPSDSTGTVVGVVQTVSTVATQGPQGPQGAQGASGSNALVDATATVKGVLRLTGDLGGTATTPSVPGLATKADLSGGTVPLTQLGSGAAAAGKYVDGGTGAWTVLPTTGGGGGTVSDATTAAKGVVQLAGDLGGTAAAPTVPGLSLKANDNAVVHTAGAETVSGAKTFTTNPTVPFPTASGHAATKGYVDSFTGTGGGGGASTAAAVSYDPSNSGVVGDTNTPMIPEYTVQDALDYLNRELTDRVQQAYLLGLADAARQVQALAGATPAATPDGTYYGFNPLNAQRQVSPSSVDPAGTTLLTRTPIMMGFSNTRNQLLAASTHYIVKLPVTAGTTYSTYVADTQTVGATLAASTYGFCLFNCDATGTLIAGSASGDAAAMWSTGIGPHDLAMGTPWTAPATGWVLCGVMTGTATTQPQVWTGNHFLANFGCATTTNVAPNSTLCPLFGQATNAWSGLTPPSTSGNVIESSVTVPFMVGLR